MEQVRRERLNPAPAPEPIPGRHGPSRACPRSDRVPYHQPQRPGVASQDVGPGAARRAARKPIPYRRRPRPPWAAVTGSGDRGQVCPASSSAPGQCRAHLRVASRTTTEPPPRTRGQADRTKSPAQAIRRGTSAASHARRPERASPESPGAKPVSGGRLALPMAFHVPSSALARHESGVRRHI